MSRAQAHDPFADFDDDFGVTDAPHTQYDDDDFDLDLKDPFPNGRPKANYSTEGLDSLDPFGMDNQNQKQAKPKPKQQARPNPSPQNQAPQAQRQRPVEPVYNDARSDLLDEDEGNSISIPRIAIHFFAETKATGMACEAVLRDRRLNRAQCVVRPGGIAGAVAAYQESPTPSSSLLRPQSKARKSSRNLRGWLRSVHQTLRWW